MPGIVAGVLQGRAHLTQTRDVLPSPRPLLKATRAG